MRGVRVVREPDLGGGRDALALALGHRPGGIVEVLARLDLDEDQQRAAAGDDVDLADRAAPAPRQDAKALGDQKSGGAALRRNAGSERNLALRAGSFTRICRRISARVWASSWTQRLQRSGARALIGHGRARG